MYFTLTKENNAREKYTLEGFENKICRYQSKFTLSKTKSNYGNDWIFT